MKEGPEPLLVYIMILDCVLIGLGFYCAAVLRKICSYLEMRDRKKPP